MTRPGKKAPQHKRESNPGSSALKARTLTTRPARCWGGGGRAKTNTIPTRASPGHLAMCCLFADTLRYAGGGSTLRGRGADPGDEERDGRDQCGEDDHGTTDVAENDVPGPS